MMRQIVRSISTMLAALVGLALATPLASADPERAPATLQLAQSRDDGPLFGDEDLEDRLNEETREAIRQFLELIEPALMQLQAVIQDLPAYEAPEILPNGDIIIRRKRGWDGEDRDDGERETRPESRPETTPKSDERIKT